MTDGKRDDALARIASTESKIEAAQKRTKAAEEAIAKLKLIERPANIGPAFDSVDLTTKAKIKNFCELWRTKLALWSAGNLEMLLVWENLELSIWEDSCGED